MDKFIDYYHILGLPRGASKQEIKKAYRNLVQIHHPDKGGTNEEFILIKTAFDTLYSDHKREQYNRIYDFYYNYRQQNRNTYNGQSYNNERKSAGNYQTENKEKYNNQSRNNANNGSSEWKKDEFTKREHPVNNSNRWRLVAIITSVISVILVIILILQPSFYSNDTVVGNDDTTEVSSATENDDINIEEAIHVHLEKAVDMEKEFEEYQVAISDLEQQEQELYGEIISLGLNQYDQRQEKADKALTLNVKRTNLIQLEKESMDASRKEFEKIYPMIESLGSLELQEKAEKLYDTMQERYEAHNKLSEVYVEAIEIENEMYENLKQKSIEEQTLDDQVDQLNMLYERVLESNNLFNRKTEEYNKLKSEFYEFSGLSIW